MTLKPQQKDILKEVLLSWLLVILGGKAVLILGNTISSFADYSSVILSALLIYVPLFKYYKKRHPIDFLPTDATSFRLSFSALLLTSALVFSAAILFVSVVPGFSFLLQPMPKVGVFFLYQLITVAFPEEFFFRGYMQERFNYVWGKPFRLFGIDIGQSLLVTSLIFALSHSVMAFQPWHVLIFFPSLVFGLLREKTGSIWASVFFHALANVFSFCVYIHYPLL